MRPDRFDGHLPAGTGLRALEVGGTPGQYLAYMHRRFGYTVTCLDYSPEGCLKARENFHLLGIDGEVVVGDLFDRDLVLEPYDVVYSLGLVEHFSDLETVVRHHLRFLRPGEPCCSELRTSEASTRSFLTAWHPKSSQHCEATSMDLSRWPRVELALALEVVYRGYLGGLSLAYLWRGGPSFAARFSGDSLRRQAWCLTITSGGCDASMAPR